MLQQRKEAAMMREKNLSQAFSQQVRLHISSLFYTMFHRRSSVFLFVFTPTVHELTSATLAHLYQRYGGLVGARQWAMKTSLKRDQNG